MAKEPFFSEKNEAMLQRVLYNDICRRTGNDLTEKQATRLINTVKHYMQEVQRVQGSKSVSVLNQEVLRVVLPDYLMYIERQQVSDGRSVVSDIEAGPGLEVQGKGQGQEQLQIENSPGRLQQDVGTAFSQLQASRQETKARAPIQDFRISLQDEGPVPMDVFERIKKDREEEAARVSASSLAGPANSGSQTPFTQRQTQQSYAEATDVFSRGSKRASEEADAAFAERERAALNARAAASSVFTTQAPPDIRSLFMGDRQTLDRRSNQPQPPVDVRSSGAQMIITREPDTITYKENELNLFVYSGDRDWISNSQETRYNFTVNFDPSNLPTGLRLNPTSTAKFRNIVRVEFVKAIMPGEGLDLMVSKSSATEYASERNINILSYPYIQVRIPELDNNVYGTNNSVNSAFAVLQYDANWISDTGITNQRGFLAMIPKFLKCQKVYSPTPLATIQKLSFRFERPDGGVLSTAPDTLDIGQIYPTIAMRTPAGGNFPNFTGITNTFYKYHAAVDASGSAYYWLQTKTYFNHWTVSKGDRILVKNLAWPSAAAATGNAIQQLAELLPHLQGDAGLLVVDTGVITGSGPTAVFTNSYNDQGYANAVIVRGKFTDPTLTGGLYPVALGGIVDTYAATDVSQYLVTNSLSTGRLLNQSHQVQVAMRVITRELDSTGVLRPDNL
jgi:hypothetical protein